MVWQYIYKIYIYIYICIYIYVCRGHPTDPFLQKSVLLAKKKEGKLNVFHKLSSRMLIMF